MDIRPAPSDAADMYVRGTPQDGGQRVECGDHKAKRPQRSFEEGQQAAPTIRAHHASSSTPGGDGGGR